MRTRRLGLLAAVAVLLVAGCSAPTDPRVSFYADGDTVRSAPLLYCDVRVSSCEQPTGPVSLDIRPGMPVQVSVPGSVARTPWTVTVQYRTADGTVRKSRETFTDGEQYAYTVTPPTPTARILVVEVQQLGAAYAADSQGDPILDDAGSPQLVARGVWSVQASNV